MARDEWVGHRLRWGSCLNVRDLGGYETVDGRRTRRRALVRADDLCRLGPEGRAALVEYGVRTIIDLRSPSEVEAEPHPFAHAVRRDDAPTYLSLPIDEPADAAGRAAMDAGGSQEEAYRIGLETSRARIAAVVAAVARAPEGGVLVHCREGKDRTGVVVALLLALADVPNDSIAEDYAVSEPYLHLPEEELAGDAGDPLRSMWLRQRLKSSRRTMLGVLAYLRAKYGGVREYLLEAGVSERDLERVRARLREQGRVGS